MTVPSTAAQAALRQLREHLDVECTEVDGQGRYVLDFEAMNEIVDALDEIEAVFSDDKAEGGSR